MNPYGEWRFIALKLYSLVVTKSTPAATRRKVGTASVSFGNLVLWHFPEFVS